MKLERLKARMGGGSLERQGLSHQGCHNNKCLLFHSTTTVAHPSQHKFSPHRSHKHCTRPPQIWTLPLQYSHSTYGLELPLIFSVLYRQEVSLPLELERTLRYNQVEAARASVTRCWPSERLPLNCAKREGPHVRPGVHLVPPLSPARPAQSVRPAPALVTVPSHHARHPHFSGVCSDEASASPAVLATSQHQVSVVSLLEFSRMCCTVWLYSIIAITAAVL